MTLLTQEYMDTIIDLDELENTYSSMLNRGLEERIKSGNAADDTFRLPEGFRDRIIKFLEERKKVLRKKILWFTYRVDATGTPWVDFPVVGYRFGNQPDTALNTPSVMGAVKRMVKRNNILKLTVSGPVPQHWFHGPMAGFPDSACS